MSVQRTARRLALLVAVAGVAGAARADPDRTDRSGPAIGAARASSDVRGGLAGPTTPGLTLSGLDGVTHQLAEWRGKVVILNFWASWCSPCLQEIRDFVVLQEQYGARGLQIIGVGLDDANKLRNVQRTLDINYPVLVADPADSAGLVKRWGNRSGIVPYSVVLDRDGRVVATHHGLLSRETFEESILPLLGQG